jgi:hypothetical protein
MAEINGHEYVDLGLPSGILWATCNIGANSPEEYGDYFAWGEVEPKEEYTKNNYKYWDTDNNCHTKYNSTDNKIILDIQDDAANINWGDVWRMPTVEEFQELLDNCTWSKTTKNGISGYAVINSNGDNIFLPFAGCHSTNLVDSSYYGFYYNNSLDVNNLNLAYDCFLYFTNNKGIGCSERQIGLSIRPVALLTHTLILDNNKISKDTIIKDVKRIIISNFFTSEKEYVASYNTQPDGSGISYNIGDTITLTEDTTLYAQWKDKPILYIVPEEGKTLTIYCEPGELVTLEKSYWDKYHNCIGYTTQKDGTEVEYKIGNSIIINEDTTLYVIWEDLTNGVEYIDLGLPSGNIWAKEDLKGYYAWGEVETKSEYYTTNYKHSESNWNDLIKYNSSRNNGKVDNKKTLELIDDVANVVLKSTWHTPSVKDWQELIDNCTLEYIADGVKLISKINQNYITLKSNGVFVNKEPYNEAFRGYYWTNERNKKQPIEAYCIYFNDKYFGINSENRPLGLSIKAVINLGKPETPETPEDPETPDIPTDPEEPELPDNPGTSTGVEEIPETGEVIEHKIGTYNIRYWNGENDSNNQGEIAWPNRKDGVLNFLCGKYGGAIFGLQEITSQMYLDLQISGSTYYGYGRDNGQLNENAAGEQIGIFKNSTAPFQILRYGSFFYKTKEKSSFNRLCVWTLVQSTINGKKFYIFNNHLAHDSATVRKQQVEILLKKVEEIAGDNIVFIVGDFNLVDTEESYSLITAKYNDAYKLAENPQGGYDDTNNTYTGLYSTTDNTPKRVDYIFTNLDTVESYIADNDNMGLEKYPSDHLPVVATFKF